MKYRLKQETYDRIIAKMASVVSPAETPNKTNEVQKLADVIYENFGYSHNDHIRRVIEQLGVVLGCQELYKLPTAKNTEREDAAVPFVVGTIINHQGGHSYMIDKPVLVLFGDIGIGTLNGFEEEGLRNGNHILSKNIRFMSLDETRAFLDEIQKTGFEIDSYYSYVEEDVIDELLESCDEPAKVEDSTDEE